MNIKTIIERINVVTRSRFSANGGASWIQWASDIISRIERECPGTGNLKDVQALPMASGFIPKPMSLIDITHVLVDGLPVRFEKTDAGIRLIGDDIPALTGEIHMGTWTQTTPEIGTVTVTSAAYSLDDALNGFSISCGDRSAEIFESRMTSELSASIKLAEPSKPMPSAPCLFIKSNVILRGYKVVHKPGSLTEEFDMDDRYYQLLTCGLHMMAEQDMEPAGKDAMAREQAFLGELRRYRVNLTQARGKAAPKRYSFTPRLGGNW